MRRKRVIPDYSPERRALYNQLKDCLGLTGEIAGSRRTPLETRIRALEIVVSLADIVANLLRDVEPDHIESKIKELEREEEEAPREKEEEEA